MNQRLFFTIWAETDYWSVITKSEPNFDQITSMERKFPVFFIFLGSVTATWTVKLQ